MNTNSKLMDMLTGYGAAHQHPFNIFVHMIGIPAIMLGVMIPFTWMSIEIGEFRLSLAQILIVGFFVFYATLDAIFAVVFAIGSWLLLLFATKLAALPSDVAWLIAAACFFGGYAAQFVGHAVEKSMPVLVKHPIQANLAAPFFTVVELFKIVGLRDGLFNAVKKRIDEQRQQS